VCLEALQLVMTAAGHSNEAMRKIVSNCLAMLSLVYFFCT